MNQPQDDPTPPPTRALRITVARSGGVAGIAPTWSITATAAPEVDSWLSLVESCPWDAPITETETAPAPAPTPGVPDRFVYTIRVVLAEPSTPEPDSERDARIPERAQGPRRPHVDRVKDASSPA